ncbi:hypothetical protein CWI36_1834p0010 [Hamiltosporidium magnivora]|uniref:Uncharacterized protein n=1 Tax=Hamiltosporidium magnivora TaxID=148818 RepID=A0A4Q9KXY4_9MICR|nr:hypothetical protein CWI36_1834p0010 [Hamiltosporidium magnivora]
MPNSDKKTILRAKKKVKTSKNEDIYFNFTRCTCFNLELGMASMEIEIYSKYVNITEEKIVTYLNLYMSCEKKLCDLKRSSLRRILSTSRNSRYQVDLIDSQLLDDDKNIFILLFQDHDKKVKIPTSEHKKKEKLSIDFYFKFSTSLFKPSSDFYSKERGRNILKPSNLSVSGQ